MDAVTEAMTGAKSTSEKAPPYYRNGNHGMRMPSPTEARTGAEAIQHDRTSKEALSYHSAQTPMVVTGR